MGLLIEPPRSLLVRPMRMLSVVSTLCGKIHPGKINGLEVDHPTGGIGLIDSGLIQDRRRRNGFHPLLATAVIHYCQL